MLAIIGGSGLTQLANLEVTHRLVVRTPYGEPSGALTFGTIGGKSLVFLARHGYGHTIPPHEVNYRANIWALYNARATRVVSVASVGGIRGDLVPGALAVPDQILDYTCGRESTFYSSSDHSVMHIDFTRPYDERLRQHVISAAARAAEKIVVGGTYAATQGPRLETAAEINRLERDGADMVGMTGMPEAALAREIGLPYAAIAVVVNHAAGRGESMDGVKLEEIRLVSRAAMTRVRRVLDRLAESSGD